MDGAGAHSSGRGQGGARADLPNLCGKGPHTLWLFLYLCSTVAHRTPFIPASSQVPAWPLPATLLCSLGWGALGLGHRGQ